MKLVNIFYWLTFLLVDLNEDTAPNAFHSAVTMLASNILLLFYQSSSVNRAQRISLRGYNAIQ